MQLIDVNDAMDETTLTDWYISSVDNIFETPVWTEEHIEELLNDFYVIPKNTPVLDEPPTIHAYWIELPKALNPNENPCKCSNCGHILSFYYHYPKSKYCDECGARMNKEVDHETN